MFLEFILGQEKLGLKWFNLKQIAEKQKDYHNVIL